MKIPTGGRDSHRNATKVYVDKIDRVLKAELETERSRLIKGPFTFLVQDLVKFRAGRVLNIELPDASVQDRVVVRLLESKDNNKVVAKGFVSSVEDKKVIIQLDKKPVFEEKKKDDKNKTEREDAEGSRFEIRFDIEQFDERAERFRRAINSLESADLSPHIMNSLLGYYEERDNTKFIRVRVLNLAESPKLSKKQMLAVEQSLMKRISLIEGVAGSGKTLVAANIAYSMSRIHKERRKVLICSPLQATVNQLAKILRSEHGIFVVQLTPDLTSDRLDKNYDSSQCLEEIVKDDIENRRIKRMQKQRVEWLKSTKDAHVSAFRTKSTERALLREADVVCCTLEQSLADCLRSIDFKALIIDDAQYSTEYECLLATRFKSIKQIILIGDMRRSEQLASHAMRSGSNRSLDRRRKNRYERRSSFIADNRIRRCLDLPNGLNHDHKTSFLGASIGSLFDRWLARGLPSVVLKFPYRRINKLDVFLSQCFYPFQKKALSISRKVSTEQSPSDKLSWPPKSPIMFDVDMQQYEEIVRKLSSDIRKWDDGASICLITNNDQDIRKLGLEVRADVGCVGDFLGQQRNYVILISKKVSPESMPRRKSLIENDYLNRDDALMIALTRACHGLFIITDLREAILDGLTGDNQSQPIAVGEGWKSLVQYCKEENLVLTKYPDDNPDDNRDVNLDESRQKLKQPSKASEPLVAW